LLVKPIRGRQKSPFHFQARFFDRLQRSRYHPVAMKPTNSQFVPGRVASKTPFLFSAHDLAVVLVFMLSAVYLRAEETPAAPGASEGEKLERDRWRLISKQRIGRLLKAESPMDFSPFDTVTLKDVNGKITAEIE